MISARPLDDLTPATLSKSLEIIFGRRNALSETLLRFFCSRFSETRVVEPLTFLCMYLVFFLARDLCLVRP